MRPAADPVADHVLLRERRTLPTGLRKICPRCGRDGVVLIDEGPRGGPPQTRSYTVIWSGAPRHPDNVAAGMADADSDMRLDELCNPDFGCGYDDGAQRGARRR